jgi:hypothetical protein
VLARLHLSIEFFYKDIYRVLLNDWLWLGGGLDHWLFCLFVEDCGVIEDLVSLLGVEQEVIIALLKLAEGLIMLQHNDPGLIVLNNVLVNHLDQP